MIASLIAYVDDGSPLETGILLLIFGVTSVFFMALGIWQIARLMSPKRKAGSTSILMLILTFSMLPLCAIMLIRNIPSPSSPGIDWEKEHQYRHLSYKKLGERVGDEHPGKRILVLTEKFVDEEEDEVFPLQIPDEMRGISAGLNGREEVMVVEMVETLWTNAHLDDEEREDPFTAEVFDALQLKYKDYPVIVSTIGLPQDFKKMKLWQLDPAERPSLYLANCNIYDLKSPIKDGTISAVVVDKPVPLDIMAPMPSNEDQAFDHRYLLITPENVENMATQYPDLFRKEQPD